MSTAGKIVNGDTNGKEDSFLRNWYEERTTGPSTRTFLLAVSPTGDSGVCPGIANTSEDTKAISTRPYVSGDGKAVVFVSGDCNLTPDAAHGGPDTNLMSDIFLRRYGVGGQSYRGLPAPARLLDTRPGGPRQTGCSPAPAPWAPAGVLALQVASRAGVPAGASSAVLNVTVTGPAGPGLPDGLPVRAADTDRLEPELRRRPDRANAVVAKLSTDGKVCLFTSAATHLIADVGGYFPNTAVYTPLSAPARLADTRPGGATVDGLFAGIGMRPAGSVLALTVAGRAGVPAGAASAVLNVTVTGAAGAGFVTVYPCGQPTPSDLQPELRTRPDRAQRRRLQARHRRPGLPVHLRRPRTSSSTSVATSRRPRCTCRSPRRPACSTAGPARRRPTVSSPGSGCGWPARSPSCPSLNRAGVPATAGTVVLNVTATGATGAGLRDGVPVRSAPAERLEPQLRGRRNRAERRRGDGRHWRQGVPVHVGGHAPDRRRLRHHALSGWRGGFRLLASRLGDAQGR